MSLQRAVRSCFSKYVDFSGCATRFEYLSFLMFTLCLWTATYSTLSLWRWDVTLVAVGLLAIVLGLPLWSTTVRRLHDSGHSGWWTLIGPFTLIGFIPLFFFLVQKTRWVDNPYRRPIRVWTPTQRAVALVMMKKMS